MYLLTKEQIIPTRLPSFAPAHSTLFFFSCCLVKMPGKRKMFKQLVKINVGARNLKRKKNSFFFCGGVRRVNCIFFLFVVCVCVYPALSFLNWCDVTFCIVYFSVGGGVFLSLRSVFFLGGTAVFTLGRHRRWCVDASQKKRISRLSLRGLSYLTLVKQTRAGLPNFVCCFYAPCEDQRRRHFSLK